MSKFGLFHFCLILTNCLSIYAFANEQSDVVIVKEMPGAIYENSSEHNRIGKVFQLTLMPFGGGPANLTWSGINLGYFLTRNSSIVFNLNSVNKYSRNCSGDLSCSVSGQAVSLGLKNFITNSFYYTGILNYRKVEYSEEEKTNSIYDYAYDFSGNATTGDFSIGNQWQWQNFTLGCDWIGLSLPILNNIDSETVTGNITQAQNSLDNGKRNFLESTTVRILNFYLGASF